MDEFKELARCYLCGKTWNMTLNVRWGGKQRSSKVTTTKNSRESLVRYQEVQITISEMRKCLDCSFAVCMDNPARTSSHSFIKVYNWTDCGRWFPQSDLVESTYDSLNRPGSSWSVGVHFSLMSIWRVRLLFVFLFDVLISLGIGDQYPGLQLHLWTAIF